MPANETPYEFIKDKIGAMKNTYPSLRGKDDAYVFSALAVKSSFYKNPAIVLNESEFDNFIVDGPYDGGVDVLLSDPNSENSDMVIGQSKYCQSIAAADVMDALNKMASFFKDMQQGHYECVSDRVQRRFISLYSEVGEESKIKFVFYTSAHQGNIQRKRLEKKFREQFTDVSQIELQVYFGADVVSEIKESESRRPNVEAGEIALDKADNYLLYGDDAAIVNVSAFSIKSLYAQYGINLLARNLRYHVSGRDIDKGIKDTIENSPETFWFKNNGITIICDQFTIDGKKVELSNFSIVNGGQTSYMLWKSKSLFANNDFYLPCKIIKTCGNTEDEKNAFSLAIAKATNSQKAIKPVDLKANSPEQIRFGQSMREIGIYYQTKRGETVPKEFNQAPYLNSDLAEIGKLSLSGVFQMPGTSRNKPSTLYQPQFYDVIFDGDQAQIAKICKELLYVDYYFRNSFLTRFDSKNQNEADSTDRITFAHNSRTTCIAFVALSARYRQKNIGQKHLQIIFDAAHSDGADQGVYNIIVEDLSDVKGLFPDIFLDKEKYNQLLYDLFMLIVKAGITCYTMAHNYDDTLNATNYLKKDKNYYMILKSQWSALRDGMDEIFSKLYYK